MAKSPAVLFYTADFLVGTKLMNYEQKGKYIELLCLQHQQGHLSEDDMLLICGGFDKKVFAKFEKDEDGLFYNTRMELEKMKRENFIESQHENGSKGGRPKKPKENPRVLDGLSQSKPKENPIENDNENINVIINYLNKVLSTKYKSSSEYIKKNIRARLGEGFTPEDFYTVIDKKFKEWTGTKMEKFLRPETLFGTKFQEYLNQIGKRDDEYTAPSQAPPIKRLNPRHGDFDPNEAFKRALDRSYGKQEKEI